MGDTTRPITSAFGDPTRRRIYLLAHERSDGVTAAEVAEVCDLHPNVARHHLDKLAGAGHLPQARDPVKVNLCIREFVESLGGTAR